MKDRCSPGVKQYRRQLKYMSAKPEMEKSVKIIKSLSVTSVSLCSSFIGILQVPAAYLYSLK